VASGREAIRRGAREGQACKARVLVLCAYLRPGRDKGRSRYVMQPISGLHVASLLDPNTFEVRLYHEDWHGPFETSSCGCYDLVFLTGLQPDFDRMRQLAYFFKRDGAVVVAGGSVCTSFPEFAAQFFDVVCAGGVESARDVAADFLRGDLKTIYRSDIRGIAPYAVDYSHFARSGVNPIVHLVETSRGCSFKCNFCSIPAEAHGYAAYDLTAVSVAIDSSLASAPLFSFRRWYPIVMLLDNNFSDNRDHMLKVCDLLKSHKKVRGWGALVTQNVLHDRELIQRLSQSKCNGLFIGLESLDRELLRRQNKTQNLGRHNIIEDIAFVESLGVGVTYGYLFDPRHQTAADMRGQVQAIARHPLMPMPTYFSVIAPIAGTKAFWDDLASGGLAANLRLRDLEGETIAYSRLADDKAALVDFLDSMRRRPWRVVGRFGIVKKTLRRILRSGTWNPVRWCFIAAANFHFFLAAGAEKIAGRTYLAGGELDPQYFERPADLSDGDRERYFEPIAVTDAHGGPADWLKPYFAEWNQTGSRVKDRRLAPHP
jgi:hypothetical protein